MEQHIRLRNNLIKTHFVLLILRADETGWEWTNSNRNELKRVPGSRVRYNATVSVTKTWLAKYSKIFT